MVQNMVPWRGVLATEETRTGDGRQFHTFTWRTTPLPLKWQPTDMPGHEGSVIVGRIDRIWNETGMIRAEGLIDASTDAGQHAIQLVETGQLRGVSVDPGGYEILLIETENDVIVDFPTYEIGAATLVPVGAFSGAWVALEGMPDPTVDQDAPAVEATGPDLPALVASGPAPDAPPSAWFTQPALEKRAGLHVEPDGRIWGHIYGWHECHVGSPPGQCLQVDPGGSYAHMVDVDGRGVLCSDGTFVQTGPICIAADHADLAFGWLAAKDHYAHTSLAVADVVVGEDEYGIWVAGGLRPGAAPEQVRALRASAPSGDWRWIGGRLTLVAILSVNMPGFPALAASISGGHVNALIASGGMVTDCSCGTHQAAPVFPAELIPELLAMARTRRAEKLAEIDLILDADRAAVLAALDVELAGMIPQEA